MTDRIVRAECGEQEAVIPLAVGAGDWKTMPIGGIREQHASLEAELARVRAERDELEVRARRLQLDLDFASARFRDRMRAAYRELSKDSWNGEGDLAIAFCRRWFGSDYDNLEVDAGELARMFLACRVAGSSAERHRVSEIVRLAAKQPREQFRQTILEAIGAPVGRGPSKCEGLK